MNQPATWVAPSDKRKISSRRILRLPAPMHARSATTLAVVMHRFLRRPLLLACLYLSLSVSSVSKDIFVTSFIEVLQPQTLYESSTHLSGAIWYCMLCYKNWLLSGFAFFVYYSFLRPLALLVFPMYSLHLSIHSNSYPWSSHNHVSSELSTLLTCPAHSAPLLSQYHPLRPSHPAFMQTLSWSNLILPKLLPITYYEYNCKLCFKIPFLLLPTLSDLQTVVFFSYTPL